MKIRRTEQFKEDYARLPKNIQGQVVKTLALFFSNPRHPSLRIKKMQGFANIWEARITKNYRLTFQMGKDTCILRRIGVHAILKSP